MTARKLIRAGFAANIVFSIALSSVLARAQTAPPPEPSPYPPAATAPSTEPAAAPSVAPTAPAAVAPATPAATPAPSDAADAAADAAAADAAAAAAAELASNPGNTDTGEGFKLNIYGFADFTYSKAFKAPFTEGSQPSSFAVGKLNLYAGAELGDNWRSLAEIRFMYLPNGTYETVPGATAAPPRTDTSAGDYTDLGRPVRWGGISIERAWLEHTFHPAFTVRVGSWLTPYGIWNVDHGSPVIIGVRRPFIIGEALFPEHQTGVEAYGALNFGPSQFGYHLTLSNGRGPIDTYQDLDNNKGVGARLFFKHDSSFGTLTVGASGYRGKYTDSKTEYAFNSKGDFVLAQPVTARYDELSLAMDVKYEYSGLLVQGEAILNDVAYVDKYRPAAFAAAVPGPPGFNPDYRRLGVYGLAGYRTSFFGIMPFFGGEYYDMGLYSFQPPAAAVWGGINARPTARVVLKAQFTHSWYNEWAGQAPGNFNGLDLQAAWSF
ncbi:MAG TPA: hypothetical protein VFQ35_17725 [Polyangiaceae bacterium]|nr:hypothetical protein [Polyangiaceae bacterium]